MVGDEIPLARAATAAEKEEKHSLPAVNPSNQQPSTGWNFMLFTTERRGHSQQRREGVIYMLSVLGFGSGAGVDNIIDNT